MARRLQLQSLLESITEHVYFQPPTNVQLNYPCIIYERDNAESLHADNANYRYTQRYSVTVVDQNPDSLIPASLRQLPMCTFNRHFTADQLNHDVFNLFF